MCSLSLSTFERWDFKVLFEFECCGLNWKCEIDIVEILTDTERKSSSCPKFTDLGRSRVWRRDDARAANWFGSPGPAASGCHSARSPHCWQLSVGHCPARGHSVNHCYSFSLEIYYWEKAAATAFNLLLGALLNWKLNQLSPAKIVMLFPQVVSVVKRV